MLRIATRSMMVVFWVCVIYSLPYLSRLYTKTAEEDRSISILTWADVFDQETLDAFTKKTGIKVRLSYYESNEEMLVKLQATGAKGYDIVVPSDYAVAVLREKNLLQKLDRSKLPDVSGFVPRTVGQAFDPNNEYSLPYLWEIFGLGIDTTTVSPTAEASWKLLFEPPQGVKVAMASDPREAINFAHQYIYGNPAPVTSEQLEVLKKVVIAQKKQVEAYVEFRADYLLATHNCGVAVSSSSYIMRSMQQFPHIQFVLPREGTFMTVENLVIPKGSTKTDLAYEFMQYVYQPSVLQHLFELYSFFPALQSSLNTNKNSQYAQMLTQLNRLPVHFITLMTTEKALQQWWIGIKA